MAGAYPDPPGYLFDLANDGTEVWHYNGSTLSQLSSATVLGATRGDRDLSGALSLGKSNTSYLYFWFPQLRDITAVYLSSAESSRQIASIAASSNTTTLIDGTWNVLRGTTWWPWYSAGEIPNAQAFRSPLDLSAFGVRALRFVSGDYYSNWELATIALWGTYSSGENPHRVELIETGTTNRLAPAFFDFGDVIQGTSSTRQFRVRNLSPTMTANDVVASIMVYTDTSPSMTSQFQLSLDNVVFTPSVTIGDLAPGTNSPTIYLRRATSATALLGVARCDVRAAVTGGMS